MKYPIHVILEDIRSAFNVGAFFRTADAAGVEKLWLTGITPYPPHNRIPKTALGATKTIDWQYEKKPENAVQDLKRKSIEIIAVELTENARNYTKIDYEKPCALIFGNEVTGVSDDLLQVADKIVQIPMHGEKKSLNVEVSFAVVVYEIIRKWQKQTQNN
ncbi:TrmH family RNA methyltransferase [Candidatus Dojkabacteria bacterium]|nr:TrmH family RNA methyltransferase [Candidatus Dojkabacteria bacterium]